MRPLCNTACNLLFQSGHPTERSFRIILNTQASRAIFISFSGGAPFLLRRYRQQRADGLLRPLHLASVTRIDYVTGEGRGGVLPAASTSLREAALPFRGWALP